MSETHCPPLFGGRVHHFQPVTIKDPFDKNKPKTVWMCKHCGHIQEMR